MGNRGVVFALTFKHRVFGVISGELDLRRGSIGRRDVLDRHRTLDIELLGVGARAHLDRGGSRGRIEGGLNCL